SMAAARVEAHLRAAAMEHLAAGETEAAVRVAGRAVALNPLDEALQELLIRSLARSGDRIAAEEQLRRCERLLAESLGTSPSPALRAAVDDGPQARRAPAPASAATVSVLIDSGKAAIDAGAFDAGIQTLRRAIGACEGRQRATALLRLGAALVHGLRGRDEEGAVHLHEAAQESRRAGDVAVAVAALRELAWVDVQAGRVTAEGRLREAMQLAGTDDELRCGVLGVQGIFLSDRDRQPEAFEVLHASLEAAERVGDRRQALWSQALLGRSALLTGDLSRASDLFAESIEGCRRERWFAFLPFPLALGAEVALARGEPPERPARLLEEAFALGCELGDPCWEGLGGSGLARLALARGDRTGAWEHAADAHRRCVRHPDRYVWIEAWVLLGLIDVARRTGRKAEAEVARRTLGDLAVRTEQPYMLSRLASDVATAR
ncbi:MAG TPA: bacterial transcriptional activator domain-containing protein, partial [Myxococcaceae bacterium]|nr:bacterial transcriptional activator domain-containing protein [Myxococcaceae bacterium]